METEAVVFVLAINEESDVLSDTVQRVGYDPELSHCCDQKSREYVLHCKLGKQNLGLLVG